MNQLRTAVSAGFPVSHSTRQPSFPTPPLAQRRRWEGVEEAIKREELKVNIQRRPFNSSLLIFNSFLHSVPTPSPRRRGGREAGFTPVRYLLAALLLLLVPTPPARAHGGEDHGAPAPGATPAGATTFSAVATSDQFEVLLRYPPLRPGADADMRLFLADFATNAPIRGAKLTFTCPEDAKLKFEVTEQAPGEYLVETTFPAKKAYSLTVQVVDGSRADLLLLEGVAVGRELPVAAAPPAAAQSWLSWKTGLLLLGTFLLGGATALLLGRRRARPAPATPTPTYQ